MRIIHHLFDPRKSLHSTDASEKMSDIREESRWKPQMARRSFTLGLFLCSIVVPRASFAALAAMRH